MIRAGVKDVKNNLSRYLARVKEGEEVFLRKSIHQKSLVTGAEPKR